jgi:hypothetical protein
MFLSKLKKLRYPILLGLITIGIYWRYLPNGFTWLDHIDLEEQNAVVPITQVFNLFFSPYSQTLFYRPILAILHSTDYALFGSSPIGYHLTNILLHSGVVILTFLLIRKLGIRSDSASFIGGLIVALSPVNIYSVGLISYRTDPLAVIFLLLALIFLMYFYSKQNKRFIFGAAFFSLCSMLSKETSVFWYPVIVILITFYFKDRLSIRTIKTVVVATLSTLSIYLALRYTAIHALWGLPSIQFSLSQALGTRIISLFKLISYLLLLRIPPISDAIPITELSFSMGIVCLLFSVLVLLFLHYSTKYKKLLFSSTLLLISIAPAVNIVALPRFISPHYLYFTTVAIGVGVAYLFEYFELNYKKVFKLSFVIVSIWLLFWGYIVFTSSRKFLNDETLFLPEVTKDPHFREGAYYLGTYYFNKKDYDKAEKYLKIALNKNTKYLAYVDTSAAANTIGVVYVQKNNLIEAEKYFEQAVHSDNRQTRTKKIYNLAVTKITINKTDEAIKLLEAEIIRSKHAPIEMYLLLARAYLKSGQQSKSRELLNGIKPLLKSPEEQRLWEESNNLLP